MKFVLFLVKTLLRLVFAPENSAMMRIARCFAPGEK